MVEQESIPLSSLTEALTKLREDIAADVKREINVQVIQLRLTIDSQLKEINTLRQQLSAQNERLNKLESTVPAQSIRLSAIENKPRLPVNDFRQILEEEKQREIRKHNLILFNVPTTNSSDEEIVKTIITKIGITGDITLSKVKRIGKENESNTIPILITTLNVKGKFSILKKAINLRSLSEDDVFRKVYIKPDMTKSQLD